MEKESFVLDNRDKDSKTGEVPRMHVEFLEIRMYRFVILYTVEERLS